MKLSDKFDIFFRLLFFLSIFFFRLPNFIVPYSNSILFSTQSIGRILLIIVFIYIIVLNFLNKNIIIKSNNKILLLILVLFFLQSYSVTKAMNIYSFISRYKDIIIGYIAFVNFYWFRKSIPSIIYIILITTLFNIIYQLIMLIDPSFFIDAFSIFIPEKHLDLVIFNINRSRLFIETHDEIFIPLLIYLCYNEAIKTRTISFIMYILTALLSFMSLWRIRILLSGIGTLFTLFFQKSNTRFIKNKLTFIVVLLIIGYLTHIISINYKGISYIDRIFISQNKEETRSLDTRMKQIYEGLNFGFVEFFGVGLGNYYDNLSSFEHYTLSANIAQEKERKTVVEYVHNIFGLYAAETGMFGLLSFTILIAIFLAQDIRQLRKNRFDIKNNFIFAFWLLFIYGFFNPPITGTYQVFFWGLRGLLLL